MHQLSYVITIATLTKNSSHITLIGILSVLVQSISIKIFLDEKYLHMT